jgi:hypothetical protein
MLRRPLLASAASFERTSEYREYQKASAFLRQAFLYCLPGQQLIGNNIVIQIGFLPEGMDGIVGNNAYCPCRSNPFAGSESGFVLKKYGCTL